MVLNLFSLPPASHAFIENHPFRYMPEQLRIVAVNMATNGDEAARGIGEDILTWLDSVSISTESEKKRSRDFIQLLHTYGFTTQKDTALLLRVSPRTLSYWLSGKKDVPHLVTHFLKSSIVLRENNLTLN